MLKRIIFSAPFATPEAHEGQRGGARSVAGAGGGRLSAGALLFSVGGLVEQ